LTATDRFSKEGNKIGRVRLLVGFQSVF